MIRGTKMELAKPPTKRFDVGASIHNRFDVEIVDAKTGKIKQRAFAENVICDQLWTRLCSANSWNYAIQYGKGSGTPSSGDTSLFSYLGYIVSSVHRLHYDYDNNVVICTTKSVLDEATAVGETITEVGIAHTNTQNSLVTHAMLKDMNGNPVSLEKSDTDIFNIYATVYVHFNFPSDAVRLVEGYRYDGGYLNWGLLGHLVGLSTMPTLYYGEAIDHLMTRKYKTMTNSYDVSNRTITLSAERLSADSRNIGGIYSIPITMNATRGGGYPVMVCDISESDGWYGKTQVRGEAIGTGDGETKDFATAFGYAKSVTVYVDGQPVESSVDSHNHTIYGNKATYPCLEYPLLSYFKLLRHPEIGYGYYNRNYYLAALDIPTSSENNSSSYLTSLMTEYPAIYENTVYNEYGVYQIYQRSVTVKASQDLKSWVDICSPGSSHTTITVPEEYRHYRYWSIQGASSGPGSGSYYYGSMWFISTDDDKLKSPYNLHLAEAPPEGSTITADYDTICVAKDENHVFDFSVTFQFNEYTE